MPTSLKMAERLIKLAAIIGVAALTACSGVSWQKSGTSPEQTLSDLSECKTEGRRGYASAVMAYTPGSGSLDAGNATVPASYSMLNSSFDSSNVWDVMRSCMRNKGYRLASG